MQAGLDWRMTHSWREPRILRVASDPLRPLWPSGIKKRGYSSPYPEKASDWDRMKESQAGQQPSLMTAITSLGLPSDLGD